MLRNTFIWAAHTLAKPQIMSKLPKNALRKTIPTTALISETSVANHLSHAKCFTTNAPSLQKDE